MRDDTKEISILRIHAFATVVCISFSVIFALMAQAKPPAMRKVHFPAKSIGKAHLMTSEWITLGSINGRFLGSAGGDYLIPATEKVALDLDPRVAENPTMLTDLAPDAVTAIRLLYADTPDSFLPAISKLSGLHRLEMRECSVSEDGLSQLAKIKNLERLVIENSDFKGDYGKGLSKIKSLRFLSLAGNHVAPSTVATISKLPNLEYLCLSRCALSNEAIKSVSSLKRLKHLDISSNAGLSAAGLQYLKACPALDTIRVPFTTIRAHDLLRLKGLALTHAELHETSLTSAEMAQLKKAFPKCKFALRPRELKGDDKMLFAPIR